LLIEIFLVTRPPGTRFVETGLQWTKLGPGATLQCNVDRLEGGGLTVAIHSDIPSDLSHLSE
jgi:hypothetical protein